MTDKIDWRTLKVGEHVTVTFDATVTRVSDSQTYVSFTDAKTDNDGTLDRAILDKATITKKEQPLKVGDRVKRIGSADEVLEIVAAPRKAEGSTVGEVAMWSDRLGYLYADVDEIERA